MVKKYLSCLKSPSSVGKPRTERKKEFKMKVQKPILILQHSEGSPPGTSIDWLKSRGLSYELFFWGKDQKVPRLEFYDGLIILGGAQNVDEEDRFPWLKTEKRLIRDAIAAKQRTFAICLGAQLVAEVCGAQVKRNDQWEVGWVDVQISDSESDPSSEKIIKVLQFHAYGFEIPSEATHNMKGKDFPEQGFRIGDFLVATQFHPEATADWAKYLATDKSEPYPQGPWVQSPQDLIKGADNVPQLQAWFFQQLDRLFLDR